jgi:hypothetical protein
MKSKQQREESLRKFAEKCAAAFRYEQETGKPYGFEQEYAEEIAAGKVHIVKRGEVVDLGNDLTLIGG